MLLKEETMKLSRKLFAAENQYPLLSFAVLHSQISLRLVDAEEVGKSSSLESVLGACERRSGAVGVTVE